MPERHNKVPKERSCKASEARGFVNSEYSLSTANIKKKKQSILITPIVQLSQYFRTNKFSNSMAAIAIMINSSAVGSYTPEITL